MGLKSIFVYSLIYLAGWATLLLIIADPFTMSTYFSDNSLLPGLASRQFTLATEAEYYLKDLKKMVAANPANAHKFITSELNNFGLDVFEQRFSKSGLNGTNLYSIIRGDRSTNSEAIALCVPIRQDSLPGLSLAMALSKYFTTKSYWAKDVIVLFVEHEDVGTAAWLESYHGVDFKNNFDTIDNNINKRDLLYDDLPDRSGPMQAAIVLDLRGREFAKVNIKIHGSYGQLPNLDLFNLVNELAPRESITTYFHDKSLPFDLSAEELYRHHYETAYAFLTTQATMKADGLHGQFLQYSIQSLTLDAPEYKKGNPKEAYILSSNMLNMGRLIESIFRSLNNLTERFNRSYYYYIILSLRRFTSIGYYMAAFGIMLSPIVLKAFILTRAGLKTTKDKLRYSFLFMLMTFLGTLSTLNIGSAIMLSIYLVPLGIIA